MEIAYRKAYERDFPAINDLFNLVFGMNRTIEEFTKRFCQDSHDVHVWIGEDKGKIIASYTMVSLLYQNSQGIELRCGLVVDVMVHPDYRKMGIFTQLGMVATREATKKYFDFLSGYPFTATYADAVLPSHFKVGWEVHKEIPLLFLPIDAQAVLAKKISNKFIKFFGKLAINLYEGGIFLWQNLIANRNKSNYPAIHLLDLSDIEEITIPQTKHEKEFFIDWEKNLLEWRYDQFGLNKYFMCKIGNKLIFVISQVSIDGEEYWFLANDFTGLRSWKLFKQAISFLRKEAKKHNITSIMILPRNNLFRYYYSGFLPSFEKYYQIVYHDSQDTEMTSHLEQFHLISEFADFDIV